MTVERRKGHSGEENNMYEDRRWEMRTIQRMTMEGREGQSEGEDNAKNDCGRERTQ